MFFAKKVFGDDIESLIYENRWQNILPEKWRILHW
jgi:hypothetical protein